MGVAPFKCVTNKKGGYLVGRFQDLTGQKFGKLTVLERADDYIYKGKNGDKNMSNGFANANVGTKL